MAAPGEAMGEPVILRAVDGYQLGGHLWRSATTGPCRIAVINPATSVASRYYGRFAAWLAERGHDVLTFDYRGIGLSRPARLRGFKADWVDWGEKDFDAALRFAVAVGEGAPVDVVAHSIGGFVIGPAPANTAIRRIVTVGAQFAHWRDYAADQRMAMLLKWHVAMPALTAVAGYFPARRLGWMEDTPAGVARDWSFMRGRFEDTVRRGRMLDGRPEGEVIAARFGGVTAPILAIGLDDDPFGTVPALERLLGYYTSSPRRHLRIRPEDIGVPEIGHFAFFHDRFRERLWPLVTSFLDGDKHWNPSFGRLVGG